jgi:FAD:protein FMN transferase
MKKIITLFFIFLTTSQFCQISYTKDSTCMGVSFSITAIHDTYEKSKNAVEEAYKEIIRIEELISSWKEFSQTSEVNRQAGIIPVKVDLELFELIKRSNSISEITNGFFDISYASLDRIWDFSNKNPIRVPDAEEIKNSVEKVNYKNIVLNVEDTTVFLKLKGMKIGFGAIGKGFAANKAKIVMKNLGVESGVINASGDIATWGNKIDKRKWTIGIADPVKRNDVIAWLNISNTSVVTSGNYEKFIEIEGKKYCHIINPKTGFPVTGVLSVTIICDNTELADALATSVFVLGKEDGMNLINHLNGVESIIVDDNYKIYYSEKIHKRFYLK